MGHFLVMKPEREEFLPANKPVAALPASAGAPLRLGSHPSPGARGASLPVPSWRGSPDMQYKNTAAAAHSVTSRVQINGAVDSD